MSTARILRRARGRDNQPPGGLRSQLLPAVAGSVVTGVTGASIGGLTGFWRNINTPPPPPPLTVIAEERSRCPAWVIDKPPDQVPTPPDDELKVAAWEERAAATPAQSSTLDLLVQGTGEEAVVLRGLDVEVVSTRPRTPGAVYSPEGCGGAVARRYFDVDLDRGTVRAQAMNRGEEIDFPFTVNSREVESFLVFATVRRCDCRWRLRLRWTSGGRSGVEVIDDGGRPFHTVGDGDRDRYERYRGRWLPN